MTANTASVSASAITQHVGDAVGKRGFLKWVEASFPAGVAKQVLLVAAKRQGSLGPFTKATGLSGFTPTRGLGLVYRQPGQGRRFGAFGRLGALGDDSAFSVDYSSLDYSAPTFDLSPADATGASDNAADSSWISGIGSALTGAISAAGQAYLTVNQVQQSNQILQTNLQRAQQGLAPLPYTPAQLGLTGPTLNLGLSSATLTPILLLGGGAILLFALMSGGKRGGGSRRAA